MKGRNVTIVVGAAALAVVAASGFAFRKPILETWNIRQLGSADPEVRARAARKLGEMKSVRAIPLLVANLSLEVHAEEAAALCRIGPEGREALKTFVRRKVEANEIKEETFRLFGSLEPSEAAPVLVEALGARIPFYRKGPFSDSPGAAAVPFLAERLADVWFAEGRIAAAEFLGRLRTAARDAAPVLRRVAGDPSEPDRVRAAADDALERVLNIPTPPLELRIPPVEGEPGAEIALEIRAKAPKPIRLIALWLKTDKGAATPFRVEVSGTAAAGAGERVFFQRKPEEGKFFVGADLALGQGETKPIEPGEDLLLLRAVIRIDEKAGAGDHPIGVVEATFMGLSGRSLDWVLADGVRPVLRVKPRSRPGAPPTPIPAPDATATSTEKDGAVPSEGFGLWAEDVRVAPGAKGAAVRIFATNPVEVPGLSLGLRIDPKAARIKELSIAGTASERAKADRFLYQEHVLEKGETAAGLIFGSFPRPGPPRLLPKGTGEHAMTIIIDVAEGIAAGTVVPVQIGAFGDPPGATIFTVNDPGKGSRSVPARAWSGLILVGASPVPEPADARAEEAAVEENKSEPTGRHIVLRWTNGGQYDSVRIERDGSTIGEVRGDTTTFGDRSAGPGAHRYRIYGRKGKLEGFPASAALSP
jgi:hypothetical protein